MFDEGLCVIDIFCEFIEIAFHEILFLRKYYPESIFEAARKYGVVVHHSIHPGVNEYILNCVNCIRQHFKKKQLGGIILSFYSGDKIEKYNFKVLSVSSNFESDPFLVKFEETINNFYLKLQSTVICLDKLPSKCNFSIQLQVTEFAYTEFSQTPTNEEFPWINVTEGDNSLSSKIIPIHNIETDLVNMEIYVQHS